MDEMYSPKHLGQSKTEIKYDEPSVEILDTFPNRYPGRNYNIQFFTREFTSLCPVTGQPDFATIEINYVPSELCLESKSLKLYLFAYRQYQAFVETITNKILDDLVAVCEPSWMEVMADFTSRGGISINVRAAHNEDPENDDT